MKKVLYITNIEVPYRIEFFNQLSKKCDLTVLYERKKSSNREEKWTRSIKASFKKEYLSGIKIRNEYSFDLKIFKYLFDKYDVIIIGCYNSLIQMLAILVMRLLHKKYILNLDGEVFIDKNSFKGKIKKFFLKGAYSYLVAGEEAVNNLKSIVNSNKIYPYYFSSLTKKELINNSKQINKNINNTILVIGQYYDYKGLDIALECAKINQDISYKFIGMGKKSFELKNKIKVLKLNNIEVIPFLQKDDLYNEYKKCKMLILPSKQECWGLVINEAASFGTPIVSTIGSGAAVEFLKNKYSIFLAKSSDSEDLYKKIIRLMNYENIDDYKKYLLKKSKKYSIEQSVKIHLDIISKM